MYVFAYSSFNDAVNEEGYVALNERMINERLISCSVEASGLRNLYGQTETMKCFSAADRVLETKIL
jgi:hypothetical protein